MNLAVKKFRIFFTVYLAVKNFSNFFCNEFGCENFSNFFYNEFGCENFSNFFYNKFGCKNFSIFLYSRINFFFFVVKNEKSSHVSQTPYLVTMLFSSPRWSFFQGGSDIWGMPFKTFSGLFDELKTFSGNLGPHVPLITLWWQVKIVLCTDFYEEFDRKKFRTFFYIESECKIFSIFFTLNLTSKYFSNFFGKKKCL